MMKPLRPLFPPNQAAMILQRRIARPATSLVSKRNFSQPHLQASILQRQAAPAVQTAIHAQAVYRKPKTKLASPSVRFGSIQLQQARHLAVTNRSAVVQRAIQYGGRFAPLGQWHQALVYFAAALDDPKGHREGSGFFKDLSKSNNTDIFFNTGALGNGAEGETDIEVFQNGIWISLENNPGNVNWSNIDKNTQIRVVITVDPAAKMMWNNGLVLQVLNHEFNVHARFYNKIIPMLREKWMSGTQKYKEFQNRTTNTGPAQHYYYGQGLNIGYNKTNTVLTNLLNQQPLPGPNDSISMNNESQLDIQNHLNWYPNKPY